ncbi:MAG TPA: DUF433 domain-containing protein [Dehalococcoidia bacterium]|nr:DUF433 domain-containing protein [Dehalococcoidia bacterium]
MALTIEAVTTPLTLDSDGVARVGGTRVTHDTVVSAYDEGATPEEIVAQYAPLDLADVYAVISFYLRHRTEVDAYLRRQAEWAAEVRHLNEARSGQHGLREHLLTRRTMDREPDAPSGG